MATVVLIVAVLLWSRRGCWVRGGGGGIGGVDGATAIGATCYESAV